MNRVILSGRLTKDVTVAYTQQQLAVARFSLALARVKDKEGNDRGADFPNCVAFGRTAENLEKYSGKGLRIQLEGHLQTGSYEKDGVKHYTTDVIVDRLEIIDWKNSNSTNNADNDDVPIPEGFQAIDDDDECLPF